MYLGMIGHPPIFQTFGDTIAVLFDPCCHYCQARTQYYENLFFIATTLVWVCL
jgi:hypothetical protein